jgi:hypothetical protein
VTVHTNGLLLKNKNDEKILKNKIYTKQTMNCSEESTTYFGNYNIIENYFVTDTKMDIDIFDTLYDLGELLISRGYTEKNELLYNIILAVQYLHYRIHKNINININININKDLKNIRRCVDMAKLSGDEIIKVDLKIKNYLMKNNF